MESIFTPWDCNTSAKPIVVRDIYKTSWWTLFTISLPLQNMRHFFSLGELIPLATQNTRVVLGDSSMTQHFLNFFFQMSSSWNLFPLLIILCIVRNLLERQLRSHFWAFPYVNSIDILKYSTLKYATLPKFQKITKFFVDNSRFTILEKP